MRSKRDRSGPTSRRSSDDPDRLDAALDDYAEDGVEQYGGLSRVVGDGVVVMYEHSERWRWKTGETVPLPSVTVHEVRGGKTALWKDYWHTPALTHCAPSSWLQGFAAAASYYGGGIGQFANEHPRCPTQCHFGEKDHAIPLTEVAAVRDANPAVEIYTYPAGHGFNCDARGSYNRASVMNVGTGCVATGQTNTMLQQATVRTLPAWVDPEKDLFVLFLSNRVHPDGKGAVNPLVAEITTLAVSGAEVKTGIDVLRAEGYARLQGARIGLIANTSSKTRDGVNPPRPSPR